MAGQRGQAAVTPGVFAAHLDRWRLVPDGDPISTRSGRLLPVRRRGREPAMLKLALDEEERAGAGLLGWWGGDGAARVLESDGGGAVLMERAMGAASLSAMARGGRDDEASRVLCAVAARLHAPRPEPPPAELVPLSRWFRELEPAAAAHGGVLARCAGEARALLASPREVRPLHGDLHHGNVLDFGPGRGWLAIDPKGLVGERGFDFANVFANPDLAGPAARPTAVLPGRFARRLAAVSEEAGLEPQRLLRWVLAWTGLSAAWLLGDGDSARAAIPLRVAELAAAALDG